MNHGLIWTNKDLISIESLSIYEIQKIFTYAFQFRKNIKESSKKFSTLDNKTIINLFIEPSTRTRISFEIAAKKLNAEVISITKESSSLLKGESLQDMAKNLQALSVDVIVLRHPCSGAASYLSKILNISVINAGDGIHAHPTQALIDCFTLIDHFGGISLKEKKITILGDILFSRVARSNIVALTKLGAQVTVAGPSTLIPKNLNKIGITVCHDFKKATQKADAIILLRIQHERQFSSYIPLSLKEYNNFFGINLKNLQYVNSNALIMHPGPLNNRAEIDLEVANSDRSIILDQVKNSIAIRMAILYLCSSVSSSYNKLK